MRTASWRQWRTTSSGSSLVSSLERKSSSSRNVTTPVPWRLRLCVASSRMSQGSRPSRVADQLRAEIAQLLTRDVHDPGIGFGTLTRVRGSPGAQAPRVYSPGRGAEAARRDTARALDRASSFLRRQVGARLRLRRVPELRFIYDDSIAGQDRIEQLLNEIHAERTDSHDDDSNPQ